MTSPAQSFGNLAIDELVLPLVTAAGLELWDLEVNPRMVRVLVDRPGGIDLAALTELARAVSAALDERDDLTPGTHFDLEVSSPGVERTLRTPSHFSRYVGTTVAVKTSVAIDGARRLQGVLQAADEGGITIDGDDGPAQITYDQIQKAHTVLIWGPTAKPTAAKRSGPKATSRTATPNPKQPTADRSESMKGSAMKETAR